MSSKKLFLDGIFTCLKNADAWIDEARILKEKDSYGHACALLVHGLEAISQAFFCYMIARDMISIDGPEFKKAFSEHRIKLETVLTSFITSEIMNEELPKIAQGRGPIEFWTELIDRGFFLKKITNEIEKVKLDYTKKIMNIRNKGIYVSYNYKNSVFTSPLEVNCTEYVDLKKQVDFYYELMLDMIIYLEDYISYTEG